MTEAEDARLVEIRVDEVRDLRVRLRELAPVQARALVVRRVVAVVEDQPVAELRDEVARVVVLRPGVGVHVLDVVDEDHRPRGEKRGEREAEHPDQRSLEPTPWSAPAEREQSRAARPPASPTARRSAGRGPGCSPRLGHVLLERTRLPVRRDEVVRARDEPRVLLRVAPGDGRVARPCSRTCGDSGCASGSTRRSGYP